MISSNSLPKILQRFISDAKGSIAIMFGLLLIPFTLAAGVGLDFEQAQNYRNALQGAADAAALAGASVYTSAGTSSSASTVAGNYMNNAKKDLPSSKSVAFTITPGTTSVAGATTAYTVAVTATAVIPTAFMSLMGINTTSISVAATAENPVTTVSVNTSGFSSAACDGNTVYWYPIPSGVTVSTYVPPANALTALWSNTATVTPKSFTLSSSSQQIGFALKNVTGAKCNYGSNSFGGKQGSSHTFYSNLFPPSSQAYPSVTTDHSIQVVPMPNGGTLASVLASLPVKSFTSNPPMAAPTCGQVNGQTYVYAWNDMGGTSDDLDYNDAAYTFTCSGAGGGGGGATGVVLIK